MGRSAFGFLSLCLLPVLALIAAGCERGEAGQGSTVEVRVETVAVDERSRSHVVILEEREGSRRLPIWIGETEASSIASELRAIEPPRPNAHDLAKRLIDGLEGSVARVVVTDLARGVYYARIVLQHGGESVEIDSRPSDAIAIALRARAPLFVDERLFEKALEASASGEGSRI
jgi:bifunctional DNase/RNase